MDSYEGKTGKIYQPFTCRLNERCRSQRWLFLSTFVCVFIASVQFSSVAQLCPTLWPHEPQHARPPCPSQTPGVYPNTCPSSWWCHPAISSSVVPFSSCPQSLPASGSFPTSQLFTWGDQSIGVSASASVPPMNTQDWSPLGWTGWILGGCYSSCHMSMHTHSYTHNCLSHFLPLSHLTIKIIIFINQTLISNLGETLNQELLRWIPALVHSWFPLIIFLDWYHCNLLKLFLN